MRLYDVVDSFLADPNETTATSVRCVVLSAENYDPYLSIESVTREMADDHEAVIEAVSKLMPGAFFSPAAHASLAVAYTGLGLRRQAEHEESLVRASIAAILNSGDGSLERPWVVLHVCDEYDALRALGREVREQRLIERESQMLDELILDDGSQVFFAPSWLSKQ